MRIIIDAMGGDNAPKAIVEGVCRAKCEFGSKTELTLVGDRDAIEASAAELGVSLEGIDIVHTKETIGMDESQAR